MSTFSETINVVTLSKDKLSTAVHPLVESHCFTLTEPGDNRRQFKVLGTDPTERPESLEGLGRALAREASITILVGHGGESDDNRWYICPSHLDCCFFLDDLCQIVDVLPTNLLLVDACFANDHAPLWRNILNDDTVLLTAVGKIGLKSTARWLTNLLNSLAALPGSDQLLPGDYKEAVQTTQDCLDREDNAKRVSTNRSSQKKARDHYEEN